MRLRPAIAIISLALTLPFAACGDANDPVSEAHTEGVFVTAGDLKYQVQVSRILNPYDREDSDYFTGIPDAAERIAAGDDEVWYGVFLRVENPGEQTRLSASKFTLTDTQGAEIEPTRLPKENVYAYRAERIGEDEIIPALSSTAYQAGPGGGLVLFQSPRLVLENRPTQLHITAPDGSKAHINLDV